METRRTFSLSALGGLGLALGGAGRGEAATDSYPSRIITLVVPQQAGGVLDLIGRRFAEKLSKALGQNIIIDNRPGAGGSVGTTYVARAAPDGYTLMMAGSGTHVFPVFLQRNLPYDPVADFVPITQITSGPLVLVVKSDFPAKDLNAFLAYLRENNADVNFSTTGHGTYPQLAFELLKDATGVKATHVPYNGGPNSILAVLRGEAAFSINHIPNVLAQIRSGALKALGVADLKRSTSLPDVPTFDEQGLKGFQARTWFGLFGPKGIPAPIVARLETESIRAIHSEDFQAALLATGDEPVGGTSKEMAALLTSELAKWSVIMKKVGLDVSGR